MKYELTTKQKVREAEYYFHKIDSNSATANIIKMYNILTSIFRKILDIDAI